MCVSAPAWVCVFVCKIHECLFVTQLESSLVPIGATQKAINYYTTILLPRPGYISYSYNTQMYPTLSLISGKSRSCVQQ